MDNSSVEIWYDSESDLLEVTLEKKTGLLEPTENDHVKVRVDENNNLVGFSIFNLTDFKEPYTRLALTPPRPEDSLLPTRLAAEELGITQGRLRHLLAAGRVDGARRIGRDWFIPSPVRMTPGSRGPVGVAGERTDEPRD